MKTGDKYLNIALKRFLSHNRLKDNFLDYLRDGEIEHVSRIFPTQGLFTYPATLTYPGTSGAGYMDFSPDPITGSDGAGHILEAAGASVLIDVPFPNTAAKDYWFALHYAIKPSAMYLNPRTGIPEYDNWEEAIGRSAAPTSVVDSGGGVITLDVTSITDVGTIDYSGMTVTVWLNNPQTNDVAVAIETIAITNPAGTNIIVTSADSLGQATISTTASDYVVLLNGIVWEEVATAAGNPFGSDYTILGYRDVAGATTYDSAVQYDISGGGGHSLQNAYDFTGSGAGKDILANYQAVEITQQNTAFHEDDIIQAGLQLTKDGNGTLYVTNNVKEFEVGVDVTGRAQMYASTLYRGRLLDESGNSELQKDETVTFSAAGNTVTFSRGGVDLQLSSSSYESIINNIDLLEISGSTSDDGVYLISAVGGATTLTVAHLNGNAVSFNAADGGSALGNIYRPVAAVGHGTDTMSKGLKIVTLGDFYRESTGSALDGGGLHIISPSNSASASKVILVENESGTDIVSVDQDGDLTTARHIVSSTGNISAGGGTVTGGVGVIATTGNIVASLGNMQANTTITAGTNIISTAGDVVATLGDIEVTHASKNFVYGSARTFYKAYNAYHFVVDSSYALWTAGSPAYVDIKSDPGGTQFAWLPINEIPNGASITSVNVMMDVAAGAIIQVIGDKSDMDWGTPGVAVGVWCGAVTSSGAGLQVVTQSGGALPIVVDNSTESYYLRFNDTSGDPSGTKIYAVRITYTMVNVIP